MKEVRLLFAGMLLMGQLFSFGQNRKAAGMGGDMAPVFDRYVQEALRTWKTPGLSIAVVKDGKVVFLKGYGVTELGKQGAYTPSTVGVCASTTKAMTAVCMGMLVDEGKVQWNDKLKDIFPEFSLSDPMLSAELTVRDLFTHNAGLGGSDLLWMLGYSGEEIMKRMEKLPIAYSLHSSFIYQNCMYIAAGQLIRKLSGMSWEDFITKRLFGPIGMEHSYASYKRSREEGSHEVPHFMMRDSVIKVISYLDYDGVGPAGGVWSCASDMARWMQFMLDSAKVGGRSLLKTETFRELWRPQAFVTEREFYPTMRLTHPNWTTYGLGWFQEDYRGRMVQFHTGSLDGAVAILGLLPSERFGIYIFGNMDHSEIRHALMYKAMDLWGFQDAAGRDWSGEMFQMYTAIRKEGWKHEKEREEKRVKGTKPSLPLSAYAGSYVNEIYGGAQVVYEGDSLRVVLPNDVRLSLRHWHFDAFEGVYNYFWWDNDLVQFGLDGEGKVARMEISGVEYTLKKGG